MPKVKHTFFFKALRSDSRFSLWLSEPSDLTNATCKLCKEDFSLLITRVKAALSHA